jgi:hypothetical protein
MRHVRKKLVWVLNLNYTLYYSLMFLYCKKLSKSVYFKPLFPNLSVITAIYGQSQMKTNFLCFYTVRIIFCFDDFKNHNVSAFCSVNNVKT